MTPEQKAALDALSAAVAAMRSALETVVEPPPPPPPPPPPVEPPAPPAGQVLPAVVSLNPAAVLCFRSWFDFGAGYDRDEEPAIVLGDAGYSDWIVGGSSASTQRVLPAAEYVLRWDGVEAHRVAPLQGAKMVAFTVRTDGLAHGWHWLSAEGAAGETCVELPVFINRGDGPVSTMPVLSAAYECHSWHWTRYTKAMVPARYAPVTQPLPARVATPFADTPRRAALFERYVVPGDHADRYLPRKTRGVLHTNNQQSYYFDTLEAQDWPALPLLAGPRGFATRSMPTHLHAGRTALGGLDPWSQWKVNFSDGALTTLLGWEHVPPAARPPKGATEAEVRSGLRLVGRWLDGMKPGLNGAWGQAWLVPTLATTPPGTEIPNDGLGGKLELPHVTGPVSVIADTKNNRLVAGVFSAVSHQVEPDVHEMVGGLGDPWDVVCTPDGNLIVSERTRHRIVMLDRDGRYLSTLVETVDGDKLAVLGANRVARRLVSMDRIRQADCVLPEGLVLIGDWLHWGSKAQAQIRRVNVKTGERNVMVPSGYDSDGVSFYKLAYSDGSFGPAGTVFLSSWGNTHKGRPVAYLPDGKVWAYGSANDAAAGPGLPWDSSADYSSACAVGLATSGRPGALFHGSSSVGIREITKALPGDAVITDAAWADAVGEWNRRGLTLTHGEGGWGQYGLPQPWGVHPEVDNYLRFHGHAPA